MTKTVRLQSVSLHSSPISSRAHSPDVCWSFHLVVHSRKRCLDDEETITPTTEAYTAYTVVGVGTKEWFD